MSNLRDLQRQFSAALLQDASGLVDQIGSPQGPADELLAIYRNNLFVSLRESLETVFPVTLALVGDHFFKHMARRYTRNVPLGEGSVRHYGKGFADFLRRQSDAAGLPYLPDVARLEWVRQQVAESPWVRDPFPFDALASLSARQQGQLHFELAPSWLRLDSRYPVDTIHDMVTREAVEPIDLNQPQVVGLWRTRHGVQTKRLSVGENEILQAVAAKQSLTALLTTFGEQLMPTLQPAIQTGIVTGFQLTQETRDAPAHPHAPTQ